MTQRLYILPLAHVDLGSGREYVAPKYLWGSMAAGLAGLETVRWRQMRYVWQDVTVVVADTDDTQHATLVGQADVFAVPALDSTIPNTTARNRVRTLLEGKGIPGNWVGTGMTYRSVVRVVLHAMHYHNVSIALAGRIFAGSIDLSLTVSQLPAGAASRLQEAANRLGLDYSGVTGATTLRQLLQGMGQQLASVPVDLGGMVV